MTKLYDLAVVTHKYTKDGQEKSSWLNIGSLFQGENNPFIMLKAYFNPAGIARKDGSESILVSMFTPKDSSSDYSSFCGSAGNGSKLYDLAVGTRKYTVNGQEKTAWENVGVIIMGDKNPYMMLKAHFNPAAIQRKEGSESITVSLFRPKDKNSNEDSSTDGHDYYSGSDSFSSIGDEGFSSEFRPNDIPF